MSSVSYIFYFTVTQNIDRLIILILLILCINITFILPYYSYITLNITNNINIQKKVIKIFLFSYSIM